MNVTRTVVSTEAQAIEKTHVYNLTFNLENGILTNINCEIYRKEYPQGADEALSENASLNYVGRIAKNNGRQTTDLVSDENMLEHFQHFNSYLSQYQELATQATTQQKD